MPEAQPESQPESQIEGQVDVLVVGGGPVGLTAANLLGTYGVEVQLVERSPNPIDYPRAVSMDDESMRTFQIAGLIEPILADMLLAHPQKLFTADGRCFADIRPTSKEYGFPKRGTFLQPRAEAVLRKGLGRFSRVAYRDGETLESMSQDRDGVTATIVSEAGARRQVRARYLLGCDGGRSTIRAQLGIGLRGSTYEQSWLVIDTVKDPLSMPYAAFFCDPRRPTVSVPLPAGYRRWEFMLRPGETEEQLLDPAMIGSLLAPFGDPAAFEIIRKRVYTFHARIADRFRVGRVFLLGDAAHLMPPFAGQGMNSGIRDAQNLCWKIAAALRGRLDERVLDSYEQERRPHAMKMIALSERLGAIVMPTNRVVALLRDVFFLAIARSPATKTYFLQMKYKPPPKYDEGVLIAPRGKRWRSVVGRMFVQPNVRLASGMTVPLDEATGLDFAMLVWGRMPAGLRDEASAQGWRALEVLPKGASPEDDGQIVDEEGVLQGWFEAQSATAVVLRPDRYVAAVCAPGEVGAALGSLVALMSGRPNA